MSLTIKVQLAYLLAFAALHSLLASLQFKRIVWNIFGPKIDSKYTKCFNIFSAITFAPLVLLLLLSPGRRIYTVPSPWRWMMVAGQLTAGLLTIRAFTDAPHRFSLRQQLSKTDYKEPLKTRGVYCLVRDPFLLSGLMQIWLTPFMTTRLLLLYLLTSLYLFLGSVHWETRLLSQFGEEYKLYQSRVPRILPWKGWRCRFIEQ